VHEHYYWLALRHVFGIGNVLCRQLIEHFGSPERIFQATPEALQAVEGITARASQSIRGFTASPEMEQELELLAAKKIRIVTWADREYPVQLKNIYDPPPFLYVNGKITLDDALAVAVVGSRSASEYGRKVTEDLSRSLAAQGITVISGMARGIDSCAHYGALAGRGRTIAVLGSGVDVVYPPENKKLYDAISAAGAIVSEYPPGTEPSSYHFPARNRIISGMSRGVLVVEASPKSGSLITARLALEQGRDVFAVPGNVYSYKSKGTNHLLRSGAKLVESAQDILEELQLQGDEKNRQGLQQSGLVQSLGPELQRVFTLIPDEPVHIDELTLRAALPISRISALLLELELKGLIIQLPGKRFAKADDKLTTV